MLQGVASGSARWHRFRLAGIGIEGMGRDAQEDALAPVAYAFAVVVAAVEFFQRGEIRVRGEDDRRLPMRDEGEVVVMAGVVCQADGGVAQDVFGAAGGGDGGNVEVAAIEERANRGDTRLTPGRHR